MYNLLLAQVIKGLNTFVIRDLHIFRQNICIQTTYFNKCSVVGSVEWIHSGQS